MTIADWLPRFDFELSYPAAQVWPHLLHIQRWMPDLQNEDVSGVPDELGAVSRMVKRGPDGTVVSRFEKKLIVREPNVRVVYKMVSYEDPNRTFEAAIGYFIYNLHQIKGTTLLSYETVSQLSSSRLSAAEAGQQLGQQAIVAGRAHWADVYIPRLKLLLDAAKRD